MQTNRRDFIKAAAVTAVVAAAGGACSGEQGDPVRNIRNQPDKWVKSVCRFCGTGCGVVLGVKDNKFVALRGDNDHPTTKGLV